MDPHSRSLPLEAQDGQPWLAPIQPVNRGSKKEGASWTPSVKVRIIRTAQIMQVGATAVTTNN